MFWINFIYWSVLGTLFSIGCFFLHLFFKYGSFAALVLCISFMIIVVGNIDFNSKDPDDTEIKKES